jgi:hypothetical protein
MVFDFNLPKFLWIEAVNATNYLVNKSPTKANSNTSHEKKFLVRYLTCPISVFLVAKHM